jgi:hypothetical protein
VGQAKQVELVKGHPPLNENYDIRGKVIQELLHKTTTHKDEYPSDGHPQLGNVL